MSNAPESWAQLPPDLRAKLIERLAGESPSSGVIEPRPKGVPAQPSYAQERLWFQAQFEPDAIAFNRPWALKLIGDLDVSALQLALSEIVRRHQVLRTNLSAVDGAPTLSTQPHQAVELPVQDLSDLPETERDLQAVYRARRAVKIPFDLQRDLLIRPELFRLGVSDHVLMLTTHHIAFDGWSENVLLDELGALYRAFSSDERSPLPNLPIQYADYAHWQRERLKGDRLDRLHDYWRSELRDLPARLELPTDRPHTAFSSRAGAAHLFQIPQDITEKLKTFTRDENVTLFMTLLAAFQLLLFSHSGQRDIAVGCLVAGRNELQIEKLIGFFVNTLALRSELAADIPFRQLLQSVKATTLAGLSHQDLPFVKLVELLNPERDLNYAPLVQHTFQLRNIPRSHRPMPGLQVEPFEFDPGLTLHDLSLNIAQGLDGLTCKILYAKDLFDSATIEAMSADYQLILQRIAADPAQLLSEIAGDFGAAGSERRLGVRPPERSDHPLPGANLTRNQSLIWTGERLNPGTPLYSLPYAFAIDRELDPAIFREAFLRIIARSDALRSVFVEVDGSPRRELRAKFRQPVELLDLSREENPAASAEAWLRKRSRLPLDIEHQLFGCALIKISSERWIWYLNLHHSIADVWAIELIFRQVGHLYQSIEAGDSLDEWDISAFQSYVDREREAAVSPEYQQAKAYWERKLESEAVPLSLYGKIATGTTTEVVQLVREFGHRRMARLKELVRSEWSDAIPEEALILNALAALLIAYLHRISGNERLSLAVLFHNRRSATDRETIGLLMGVVVIRVELDAAESFRSLIGKVTEEIRASLKHRIYPVANPIQSRAYEVTLNYQTFRFKQFADAPVAAKWLHSGHDEDTLTLRAYDYADSGSLTLDFEFSKEAFDQSGADRAVEHFFKLADRFLEEPESLIRDADLLSEAERTRLLQELNDTDRQLPASPTIVQAFEEQVIRTPAQLVVVDGDRTVTYAELNRKANQLARYLRSRAIAPDAVVALHMDRSLAMLVAIMGILKAGGAYLPLNLSDPPQRMRAMLDDARVSLMLTGDGPNESPSEHWSIPETTFAEATRLSAGESDSNPDPLHGPEDLVYVMYTSGSTGTPKGVMVEHRSLANLNDWSRREYGLDSQDRVLQFASMSWDTSVEELFPCLTSGATLVLRAEEMLGSVASFLDGCQDFGITVIMLPTAYWHEIVDAISSDHLKLPPSIRLVNIGGEQASAERVRAWRASVPASVRLVNTYGLTEAAAVTTLHDLSADLAADENIPIGRPIQNTKVYVLDDQMRPVPQGCQGDLYVGGMGIARGYVNRPELTRERFVKSPFESGKDARLFRTGDVGRVTLGGNIQLRGRVDRQVKIRGFRIEPAEIESGLLNHKAVENAVVVGQELRGDPSNRRLVAYVVPDRDRPTRSELQDHLRKSVPDYMLPSAYVFLDALPLTASGKVDRAVLPMPDGSDAALASHYIAPRDPMERDLVAIWEEVLGVKAVGIADDFFDLGGHSLLAVRLFSRIEQATGRKLPVRTLFEEPTVARLAEALKLHQLESDLSPLVPIKTSGSKTPIFWIHAAGGHVLSYRHLADRLGEERPFYALQAREIESDLDPASTVEGMARVYIKEIQSVQPQGPYLLGGLSFGGLVAWEMAQQLQVRGERVAQVVLLDTRHPEYLDLSRLRDSLYRLRQRLQFHVGNLSALKSADKLRYLAQRWRISLRRLHYWRRWQGIILKAWATGQPRPRERLSYSAALKARGIYRPKVYSGRVALFRAAVQPRGEDGATLGWGGLARGGLDIYEVSGAHVSMIVEPHVRVLAEKLRRCLDIAEGTENES